MVMDGIRAEGARKFRKMTGNETIKDKTTAMVKNAIHKMDKIIRGFIKEIKKFNRKMNGEETLFDMSSELTTKAKGKISKATANLTRQPTVKESIKELMSGLKKVLTDLSDEVEF